MIRDCTEEDIPQIIIMSKRFWQHTQFKHEKFVFEDTYEMVKKCMDDKLCLVYEADGEVHGFVCGVLGSLLANFSVKVGTEVAWWVDEAHREGGAGLKLLSGVEKRAKELGIKYWNMAYMASSMPDSIKKILESRGYTESEVLLTRVI